MNYFKTDVQAIKTAINTETPFTYYPENEGRKYTALNNKGQKIWIVSFINEVMGWQISFFPDNLSINNL